MEAVAFLAAGTAAHLVATYVQGSRYFVDGQEEWAELICWILIFVFPSARSYLQRWRQGTLAAHPTDGTTIAPKSHQSEVLAKAFAILLVIAQVITDRADGASTRWPLSLITMVLFLLVKFGHLSQDNYGGSSSGTMSSWEEKATETPSTARSRPIWQDVQAMGFPVVSIGLAWIMLPVGTANYHWTLTPGIAYMLLMLGAYICLARIATTATKNSSASDLLSLVDETLRAVSPTACVASAVKLLLFPVEMHFSGTLLVLGILKAFEIASLVSLAFCGATLAASTMPTLATLTAMSLQATRAAQILSLCLATAGGLFQALSSLPKPFTNILWLCIIILLPFVALFGGLGHRSYNPDYWSTPGSAVQFASPSTIHPIQQIFLQANQDFEARLAGQSETLDQAINAYVRKYGRRPPIGFDKWFEIAQSQGFKFIDEFDTIYKSLEPFWGVEPSNLRARIKDLGDAWNLIDVNTNPDIPVEDRGNYFADYTLKWMNRTTWGDIIPDTIFYVNTLDEPRVVAPFDAVNLAMSRSELKRSNKLADRFKGAFSLRNKVGWLDLGKQDTWQFLQSACPLDSRARHEAEASQRDVMAPLRFVANVTNNKDVCNSTTRLHGHPVFNAPGNARTTHNLVPLFSQCKPAIYNDILYPSPYYQGEIDKGDINDKDDPEWAQKKPRLYWAGTSTGGWAMLSNWREMHRMRLTLLTSKFNYNPVHLLQKDESTGIWNSIQKTWADISELFHLRITSLAQCEESACEEMTKILGPFEGEPWYESYHSKYALDVDGNTFSGRYYRLLKSKSCVLKHTAFEEWHDGRLVPWVHFIPVSPGAEELGEMIRYLTQEEEGLAIGEKIAEQGKDWARSTLRGPDLEAVFVRIMLEYARLLRNDRDDWHI